MVKLNDVLACYHEAEDGDMISFGRNCAISVDMVRDLVKHSGPVVRKAFYKWISDLKEYAKEAKS